MAANNTGSFHFEVVREYRAEIRSYVMYLTTGNLKSPVFATLAGVVRSDFPELFQKWLDFTAELGERICKQAGGGEVIRHGSYKFTQAEMEAWKKEKN